MRKYLFSGLLIIVICLAGVAFWALRPLTKAAEITPNELVNWVTDTDNAVFEATNEYFYIQVSKNIDDEKTEKREYKPFYEIKEMYPRYLFVLDLILKKNINGINNVNIVEFILNDEDLR